MLIDHLSHMVNVLRSKLRRPSTVIMSIVAVVVVCLVVRWIIVEVLLADFFKDTLVLEHIIIEAFVA